MNAKGSRSTDYAFVTVWRVAGTADDVAELLGERDPSLVIVHL